MTHLTLADLQSRMKPVADDKPKASWIKKGSKPAGAKGKSAAKDKTEDKKSSGLRGFYKKKDA